MASPPSPPPPRQLKLTAEELKELARKTQSDAKSHQVVFVDPFPKEVQYECSICMQVLQKPQMVHCCGHRFSLKCLESLRSRKCPLCNHQGIQYFPDKKLERLINQRKVYCLLREDGCEWTGEFCKMSDHLDFDRRNREAVCQYLPVQCVYCTEHVRRRDMDAHVKQCSHRPSKCEFCSSKVKHNQLKSHHRTCVVHPVICPNVDCSKALRARELHAHLEACPWTCLTCEYQHAGCDRKILRKNMASHLQQNMPGHLELVKEKLSRLEEEAKNKGRVSFLVISDLPEDALDEQKLKSRFGQFGPVDRVQLLDPELRAGIVVFSNDDTYQDVLEQSGDIKLCKEYVLANPVYTTATDDTSTDDYSTEDSEDQY